MELGSIVFRLCQIISAARFRLLCQVTLLMVICNMACKDTSEETITAPAIETTFGESISGEATYYAATGGGQCSFPETPNDLMVAALNTPQYDNAMWCGACAEIEGSKGKAIVRIVDRCPECEYGDLDLSQEAFAAVDEVSKGRVPIKWRFVSCDISTNMSFHYKEGTSKWWLALQVRNHRLPIKKVELKIDDNWVDIARQSYNYFVHEAQVDELTPSFRIHAADGSILEQTLPAPASNQAMEGSAQF